MPQTQTGSVLAAKGFRPFFLLAGLYAIAIVPCWLLFFFGILRLDTYLDAFSWHAHEMIFGYTTAVIAGFLLTAVGNWTQRETLIGPRLYALTALWVLGRVVMLFAQRLPLCLPALVDLAFLPLLIVVLARPLIVTRNQRHYPLLLVLSALAACNFVVHAQALGMLPMGVARRACLLAIDLVLLVVLIIIGRVLPMFTRNATQAKDIRSLPALDIASLGAMGLLTVCEALALRGTIPAGVAGLTALLTLARAWHWGTQHVRRHPLLWVLHAGYAWIVLGLSLRALAELGLVTSSLATHALTVGVIGTLTLGMMARVALGHTGRLLEASRDMVCAFWSINLAASARALLPWLAPSWTFPSLWLAAALWSVAFLLFVIRYAPILGSPRVDGKPG